MTMNRAILVFMILSVLTLFFVTGCAPFRDSPFSDQLLRSERNLNLKALRNISDIESDGIIRIAILADSHQNYRDLDQVIKAINETTQIDFVVNLGDFTNSGYNLEYDQFIQTFIGLDRPAFNVIGNHDAIGSGPLLFQQAFGDSNFWFESETKRFVFFNSVHLEDPDGFHPDWLSEVVNSSRKPVFIFSHIHLKDQLRFTDPLQVQILSSVIANPKTQLAVNGHTHKYELFSDQGTVMLHCPRVEGVQWLLLEIQGTQIAVIRMNSKETVWMPLKS